MGFLLSLRLCPPGVGALRLSAPPGVEKRSQPLALWRREQLRGRAQLDDATVVHEHGRADDVCCEAHLVAHDQHRHAVARELSHDREHLAHELGIERRGRLVEQHDARAHRQRAGDRHPLLLPAGELFWIVAGVSFEPHPSQHLEAALLGSLPAHPFDHAQRLGDVAERRHVRPEIEVLEHHADGAAHLVDLALARQAAPRPSRSR
jgi:hypothetical protein